MFLKVNHRTWWFGMCTIKMEVYIQIFNNIRETEKKKSRTHLSKTQFWGRIMCHSKRILLDLTQTYVLRIWTTRSPKGRWSLMRLINGLEWDGTSLAQSILNQARAHMRPWITPQISRFPFHLLSCCIW